MPIDPIGPAGDVSDVTTATPHQWPNLAAGLRELRRVTRDPVVVPTADPDALGRFWLVATREDDGEQRATDTDVTASGAGES